MLHSRFEHHGYRRPVSEWNAVDVTGMDGLLQHGTVIAVEPEGLLVDFGCKDQQRELVHYGAAFSCHQRDKPQTERDELRLGQSVDVLLRTELHGPWFWRSATVLAPPTRGEWVVYVEVHLGGIVRREVVDRQQVRLPLSAADLHSRMVKEHDFCIWTVQPTPAHLVELPTKSPEWKFFCHRLAYHVSLISVSSKKLLLLGRSDSYPQNQSKLEFNVRHTYEWVYQRTRQGQPVRYQEGPCCIPWKHISVPECVEGTEWVLHDLCHDLLRETFRYLDTMDMTIRRRVCRGFDTLIGQVVAETIWITCHHCCCRLCCSCTLYLYTYQLTASIMKCANSQTRTIILTDGTSSTLSDVLGFWRMCGQLGLCAARHPVLMVASYYDIGRESWYFQYQSGALAEDLAGGYVSKLVLRRCTVPEFQVKELRFSGSLPVGCGNGDLYQLMESQVPAVDVQRAAEWVVQATDLSPSDRTHIVDVLNEITPFDPRVTNPYRDHEWSLDNLGILDVSRLSSIALYALSDIAPPNLFEQLPFANGL